MTGQQGIKYTNSCSTVKKHKTHNIPAKTQHHNSYQLLVTDISITYETRVARGKRIKYERINARCTCERRVGRQA